MRNQVSALRFTANPEAAASFHEDGVVILLTSKGRVFSSNKTGALIWKGIEQRRSLENIVEEISGEFQIAGTTARTHTKIFLETLEQQTLIRKEVAS